MRTLLLTLTTCLFVLPAQAKYSGGGGTAQDPYQIATAADLIALGETPADYDKHFVLTADIDLNPNLPGRKVFDMAVITTFSGVFDGKGHAIRHLTSGGAGLFGSLGRQAELKNLGVVDVNIITGSDRYVGGLVVINDGTVTQCYSTGTVSGNSFYVGGLMGENYGTVTQCYSRCAVSGNSYVGGLVGVNQGTVTQCYSRCAVSGYEEIGGLVGYNGGGPVTHCYSTGAVSGGGGLVGNNSNAWGGVGTVAKCFWDTQTSGQSKSAGGTGKTTAEMKTGTTFLDVGWDFVGETKNGTEDIWWILEGKDYPRLSWQYGRAFSPDPWDSAGDVSRSPVLRWNAGGAEFWHDVYFGDDEAAVANATSRTRGVYRGRQAVETTAYDPGILEWGKTYYWRIDEVSPNNPAGALKGSVWTFTTTDCIKSPQPADGAIDVIYSPILSWVPGEAALEYDVYFGDDENAVATATRESLGIYRGRQSSGATTYKPGALKLNATHYWRIDGVDKASPQTPWKGDVWRFTTGDYLVVVDDFESYTDTEGNRIYQTWKDGWYEDANHPGNGTGSAVGYMSPPFAERKIVRSGEQSMPMDYNNVKKPWYSEAERTWATPQDWTLDGADTLTLHFRGNPVSFVENAGVVTMSGSGRGDFDIGDGYHWWGGDACGFAYKRLSGSGSIVAKVENAGGLSGQGGKAGVMVRETPGIKSAYVVYTPARRGVLFGSTNGQYGSATVGDSQTPLWLKLTRTGDVFTAQYSLDGGTWTDIRSPNGQVGSAKIAMTSSVYIGLCVTSGDPEMMATAVFSDITITGDITGQWQVASIGGDPHTLNAPENLYVRIEDSTGKNASVVHPDAEAVLASEWRKWSIALDEVRAAGVDVAAVKKMVIGVGARRDPSASLGAGPKPGGTGRIYIDDIRLTKRMP